jgi:cobalamin biosynthesis Mg chelatase CobN
MKIALLSTSDTDLLSARASGADFVWANPARPGDVGGDIAKLEQLLDEHANIAAMDPAELPAIRGEIWQLMHAAQMHRDLGLKEGSAGSGGEATDAVDEIERQARALVQGMEDAGWVEDAAPDLHNDPEVQNVLRQSNPWALRGTVEKLHKAIDRELWADPDPEVVARMRQVHLDLEGDLEDRE